MKAKYLYCGKVKEMTIPKEWEEQKCITCKHFCGEDHYSFQRQRCSECKYYYFNNKDNYEPWPENNKTIQILREKWEADKAYANHTKGF